MDNRKLHEAAMAALRYATVALDYLNEPTPMRRAHVTETLTKLDAAIDAIKVAERKRILDLMGGP